MKAKGKNTQAESGYELFRPVAKSNTDELTCLKPILAAATRRRVAASLLLPVACCLLPVAFVVSAHEPITTKVRFNKEVIRVFERSCTGCHRPGGAAPFSLTEYEEARPWAKAIKEEMLEKRMPVWHAVKGFGEFLNAPLLTQREVDLVVNWVEGGAPKGDEKDYPKEAVYSDDWQLGKPDTTLKLDKEQKVAPEADEVRTFVLPTNLKEDRWLRAIDLKPGNAAVVFSASIHLEGGQGTGDRGRRKTAGKVTLSSGTDARPSFPAPALATWVPGQKSVALPDGIGRLLPANSRLVVKIRYKGREEEMKDRSSIGLYFTKATPKRFLREVAIADADAVIPANAAAHPVKVSYAVTEDSEAVAIRPFAHGLIASFQASAFLPDGREQVLIWARGSRYDWQQTYHFKKPVALPKGTRVEVTAYFDNSEDNAANPHDPPKPLRWSDISRDPLCALMLASSRAASD